MKRRQYILIREMEIDGDKKYHVMNTKSKFGTVAAVLEMSSWNKTVSTNQNQVSYFENKISELPKIINGNPVKYYISRLNSNRCPCRIANNSRIIRGEASMVLKNDTQTS